MSASLEELKQQAEAEMRRPAPETLDGSAKPKRQKTAAGGQQQQQQQQDGGGGEDAAGRSVARFSYAADAAIAAGSTCFLGTCGFNRQRSAAKEMMELLRPRLPEGTQLQHVKLACRGVAMLRAAPADEAAGPPVPVQRIAADILAKVEAGQLRRTRFCERLVPAETTCLLTRGALEAALRRVVEAHLAARQQQQQQQQQQQAGGSDAAAAAAAGPLEFAVLYKSRGVDRQALAEEEQEEQEQDKEQQQQAPEQPAPEQQGKGLDRLGVIKLAAQVMEACCRDAGGAKVNLSSPQVVLLVEVVPLIRQALACAVSVLPGGVMGSGHKLKLRGIGATAGGGGEDGEQGGGKKQKKEKGRRDEGGGGGKGAPGRAQEEEGQQQDLGDADQPSK